MKLHVLVVKRAINWPEVKTVGNFVRGYALITFFGTRNFKLAKGLTFRI